MIMIHAFTYGRDGVRASWSSSEFLSNFQKLHDPSINIKILISFDEILVEFPVRAPECYFLWFGLCWETSHNGLDSFHSHATQESRQADSRGAEVVFR